MKKALGETQTLRAGRSNAEPKKIHPAADPRAQDRQNLISWRGYLHLQTQFGEDRCTQFRVIVVTDTARPLSQTHRTDYNTLRRS